jgi:hypothetical protein
MWKDPVVEDVRAIRDEYARKFDYDLGRICEDLRRQQSVRQQSGDAREIVTLPPKRLIKSDAA